MPNSLPNANPLSYLGVRPETPPEMIRAQRAPTVADAYEIGTLWCNEVLGAIYGLSRYVLGQPDWEILGGSSSDVNTLTGDAGGAISPTAGNINILGSPDIQITGNPATSTLQAVNYTKYTPYVVGPAGMARYQTIQAALNQVVIDTTPLGGMNVLIYIMPGIYIENLVFNTVMGGNQLVLQGADRESVTIQGNHTPFAYGTQVFKGINFTNAAGNIFSSAIAGGVTTFVMMDCRFGITSGYLFDTPGYTNRIHIMNCDDVPGGDYGIVNSTAAAIVDIFDSRVAQGTVNPSLILGNSTISGSILSGVFSFGLAGVDLISNCTFNRAVSFNNTTNFSIDNCVFNAAITLANATTGYIATSHIDTVAATSITMSSTADVWIKNTSIMTSNATAIGGAGTGVLRFSGNEFIDSDGLAATLTFAYQPSTRSSKVLCGDTTYRVSGEVTADGNIIQAYGNTTGVTAGTTCRAIRGDIQIASGNSTESPQGIRGAITFVAGSDTEEGYAGFFSATQNDVVSNINSNLIGSLAITTENRSVAADQPQQWISGSQSITSFGATAAVPTAAIVCANLNHITYDAAMNALAHGVVVSRNGGGAGGTANAAYKVVIGGGIVDWNYGLDLLNGGVGALGLYGLGDIRLANGTIIDSANVTDCEITLPATGDFLVTMTNSNPGATIQNTVSGAIAAQINGVTGTFINAIGATVLQESGVLGYCEQRDGSVVSSTATGVEGWLNLLETNAADLPSVFAFAVKGYLDTTDAAGVPVGMTAGVGSVVEYNTPLNAKAYGFLATRLNTGLGAGTAGQAAYGVLQGTVAIADWLYGVDLYNGGVAYTTADIRLQNQSKIIVATEGMRYTGDIASRSLNATNIKIDAFNQSPLVQSNVNTGGVATGVAGDINLIHLQDGSIMEEFVITAQAILAPRMTATGLEIGGDQIATNGYEYNWGVDANRRFAFTAQTSAAFFIEATFVVTTVANVDHFFIGFRRNAANNANYALYTDGAFVGLHPVTAANVAVVAQSLNGPAWAYTNTTNAWVNGATVKVRVNVSDAGVVTYQINGAAPIVAPAAFTFDAGDIIIPTINFTQAAAAFTPIKMTQLAVGYQAFV